MVSWNLPIRKLLDLRRQHGDCLMTTTTTKPMSNHTITSLDFEELDRELRRMASRNVILQAAKILAATPMSTDQFNSYEVWGADEVLVCAHTGRSATNEECHSWEKYRVCKRHGVDDDGLTLEMVICDMLTKEEGYEEPDCVTYDEVMSMVIQ